MKKTSQIVKPTTPAKPQGLLSLADLDKVAAAGGQGGVTGSLG